jgi:hypothetical protein
MKNSILCRRGGCLRCAHKQQLEGTVADGLAEHYDIGHDILVRAIMPVVASHWPSRRNWRRAYLR